LSGIESGSQFAGELQFTVCGDNYYKISQIELFIDGKEIDLKNSKWVGLKKFDLPISIDVSGYSDGEHKIEVFVIDSSFN